MQRQGAEGAWALFKPYLVKLAKNHCDPLDSLVEIKVVMSHWNKLQKDMLDIIEFTKSEGLSGNESNELASELDRLAAIMEARISARTALRAAGFTETSTLSWENDTFKNGVLISKCRARRFLLQADTLVQTLQSIAVTQKRMEQCVAEHALITMPADIVNKAWQLRRLLDSDFIGPHPFSDAVPGDKTAKYWRLLMVEVNWDMHLASVRHIWKAHKKIEERIEHLTEAIHLISDLHKKQHQLIPQRILAVAATRPLVIWLAPQWA